MAQNDDLLSYLYHKCMNSGQVSLVASQMCRELLETALRTVSKKTYIIIDGIDECVATERKAILSFLTPIVETEGISGQLRALIVSQDENDIRKLLKGASVLKLTDTHIRSDIEEFAKDWCLKIQQKFGLSIATTEYIKTAVCEGSEGKFST